MKKSDLAIPYSVRSLLQVKQNHQIIFDLYKSIKYNEVAYFFLYIVNESWNKIAEDPYHEGADDFWKKVNDFDDSRLLIELCKLKIISRKNESLVDDEFSVCVEVEIPKYIEKFHYWLEDERLILNCGMFSLHTFTGESYCGNNKYNFHTSRGLFRVFKAFLTEPTHILTYNQIRSIFMDNPEEKADDRLKIHQTIGEIKEKLNMKGEFSELFVSSGKEYLLRTSP